MPSIDFSWDISGSSGGGSGGGSSSGSSGPGAAAAAADPLGSALIRPFRRTERNDFLQGFGVPEVMSGVGQVLGTEPGTLPWRPDFGCAIGRLRHQANSATTEDLARVFVQDALQQWEPRVQLTSVAQVPAGDKTISLRVTTRIGSKIQTVNVTV